MVICKCLDFWFHGTLQGDEAWGAAKPLQTASTHDDFQPKDAEAERGSRLQQQAVVMYVVPDG